MTDLRDTIAKNICELRTEAKMTQLALAEVLNYSDKAVSKWERAESVPDVFMLKRIADYFGVSVDYLLEKEHKVSAEVRAAERRVKSRNRTVITILAISLVWLIATFVFVTMAIIIPEAPLRPWTMFIYAIPVSSIVTLVFNSIWGKNKKLNYLIISALLWSLILTIHITVLLLVDRSVWQLYLLGIPGEVIIVIWSLFTKKK